MWVEEKEKEGRRVRKELFHFRIIIIVCLGRMDVDVDGYLSNWTGQKTRLPDSCLLELAGEEGRGPGRGWV